MYVPKNKPVLKGLNSYYVNLDKLLEFYRASMLSGCVHLKTHESEAAVYLNNDTIQRVIFEGNGLQYTDKEALKALAEKSSKSNFSIDIYELSEELMKFCCNIPNAETLHSNISTEFVDVNKLLQKLLADKITGFLEIAFDSSADTKYLFLNSGVIVGGSDFLTESEYGKVDKIMPRLVKQLESSKGIVNIKVIPKNGGDNGETLEFEKVEAAPDGISLQAASGRVTRALSEIAKIIGGTGGGKEKFELILRRKFLQKAEKYSFLDPFEEEVSYDGKEFTAVSSLEPDTLIAAMRECLLEIGADHGVSREVENYARALSAAEEDREM